MTGFLDGSNISADDMLYTETDLEDSMEKIETINFHEVKEVAGIKFWCYHAGHVLGAAMFMIEIAGVKVGGPSSKGSFSSFLLSHCICLVCRLVMRLLGYVGFVYEVLVELCLLSMTAADLMLFSVGPLSCYTLETSRAKRTDI